ncbi:hypothetical protein D3C81_748090 [compost metagenome]
MDFKAKRCALGVGQGMQHRRVQIVRTVQLLIAAVPCLVLAILTQDQHFAGRRVDGAETVGQRSRE